MGRAAKATTDHDTIRRWVEARGGYPAHVTRTTTGSDPGVLRIDYPGFSGTRSLERITWARFFDWFERDHLAFLYQESPTSRFSKLVDRDTVKARQQGKHRASKRALSRRTSTTKPRSRASRTSATHGRTGRVAKRHGAARRTRTPGGSPRTQRRMDLNTASESQLQRVFEIDGKRAAALVRNRPYRTWDDVKRVRGFDGGLVENIQEAGGRIRAAR